MPRKFGELPDGAPIPTPFEVAAPRQPQVTAHPERRRPALADYRSSRRRSWYLLALLTATVGFSTLSLAMLQTNGGPMGLAIRLMQRDLSLVGSIVAVSLVGLVLTLATAIAWFVWFDRVLQNVPPLTGRWTEQGRVASVTWWLVPLVGLFRGPYVVGQVYDRVRVRTGPGLWLLGLWAIFWLGGTIAPYVASWLVGFLPLDLLTLVQVQNLISVLGQVSYVVAGLFAAALVLAFEQAQAARSSGATDLEPDRVDEVLPGRGVEPAPALDRAPVSPAHGTTGAGWPADPSGAAWGGSWGGSPTAEPVGADPGAGGYRATLSASASPAPEETWPGYGTPSPPSSIGQQPIPDPARIPIPDRASDSITSGSVDAGDRFMLGVIPAIPLVVMGGAICVGLVVGVLLGQPPVQRDPDAVLANLPRPPEVAASFPTPTPAAATIAPDIAPAKVARDVVRMFTSDGYRGGMAIRATLANDDGTASSTLDVLRSGDREWSEVHLGSTGGGAGDDLERVILASLVWERTDTSDWVRRDRSSRDRPTPPLLGLTDPADLAYIGVWPGGDAGLHAFRWLNKMTATERALTDRFGVRDPTRRSATLLVTATGDPVRSLLSYAGVADGQRVRLDVVIEFQHVMARILIRSPREGPPAVVRES